MPGVLPFPLHQIQILNPKHVLSNQFGDYELRTEYVRFNMHVDFFFNKVYKE